MKFINLLVITFYLGNLGFSLSNNESDNTELFYEVKYELNFRSLTTSRTTKSQKALLYLKNDKSIFQWENIRKLDSIYLTREITNDDVSRYKAYERYTIEMNNNDLIYYDRIGNDHFMYNEKITHKWDIKSDSKIINGLKCYKANLNYGGRNWTAWYTPEIEIASGPYKFIGLPGLILEVYDETYSYHFNMTSLVKRKTLPLKKLVHHVPIEDKIKVDRITFNQTKSKYRSLSLNERLKYMNKDKAGDFSAVLTNNSGEENNIGNKRIGSMLNPIEIDHLD